MNKAYNLQTPLIDKILEMSSNLLIVFKILVDKFKLTTIVFEKLPKLQGVVSPEVVTLILTVIVGLVVISIVFGILINICKITLNFAIFAKWFGIIILFIGIMYNVLIK